MVTQHQIVVTATTTSTSEEHPNMYEHNDRPYERTERLESYAGWMFYMP